MQSVITKMCGGKNNLSEWPYNAFSKRDTVERMEDSPPLALTEETVGEENQKKLPEMWAEMSKSFEEKRELQQEEPNNEYVFKRGRGIRRKRELPKPDIRREFIENSNSGRHGNVSLFTFIFATIIGKFKGSELPERKKLRFDDTVGFNLV